jgi:hypothetical protein
MRIQKFSILFSIVVVLVYWFNYQISDYRATAIDDSISTIIYDMTSPHEGMPHGVSTSYDWALGPRLSMGNNPEGFKAMTAWGQLYESARGNPATNTRVQIKNLKAYMLSKQDNKWHLLQSSKKVEGAAYREDFAGDVHKPADIRYEQDSSVSVKAGQGYNFHFWCPSFAGSPYGRVSINPEDVAGIFTTVQARLITDNLQQPDDRFKARYLLSVGGDYWLNLTAQWDKWTTNSDIGIGKFKHVTTKWQAFNMITLPPTEIRKNPPPILMD